MAYISGPGTVADARVGRPDPEGGVGPRGLHERAVPLVHRRHQPRRGHPEVGLRTARRLRHTGTSLRHDQAQDTQDQVSSDSYGLGGSCKVFLSCTRCMHFCSNNVIWGENHISSSSR